MENVKFKHGDKVSIQWGREYHGYDSDNGYDIPDHGLVECLGAIKPSLYLFYKYSSCGSGHWFLYDSKHNIMFFEVRFLVIDNRTGYKVKLLTCEEHTIDDNIKVPKSKLVKFLKTHSWEFFRKKTNCWFKPYINYPQRLIRVVVIHLRKVPNIIS